MKNARIREQIYYLLEYYGFLMLLGLVSLLIAVTMLWNAFFSADPHLYIANINIVRSENLVRAQTVNFLNEHGFRRKKIDLTTDLHLTGSHTGNSDYVSASMVKLLASIQAGKMDIVFMDEVASDYLRSYDLFLINRESQSPVLDVSDSVIFQNYNKKVFLGIVKTSPRIEEAAEYAEYIVKNTK